MELPALPGLILGKQGVHEIMGVERAKIVNSFANADVTDWDAQLFGDGKDHPALCGTVQFGQGDTRHADRLLKLFCLCDGVLSDAGVQHQQNLMWRTGIQFSHYASNFFQFFHQIALRMQAAGCVGD